MKKIFTIALVFIFNLLYSQNYELGKVTIDELKEKVHPIDTSAGAAVLFQKGKLSFNYDYSKGFNVITEVNVKIKIYNKKGLDYANQSINYYNNGSSKQTVVITNAATYNLIGDKINKTKLTSEGEFDEKLNKFWSQRKISFPNVKQGSIVEYSYKLTSPNYGRLNDWKFQSAIPVNYSEFQTFIPEYFDYNVYFKGFLNPEVVRNVREKSFKGSYEDKDIGAQGGYKVDKGTYEVKFNEHVTKYSLLNAPGLKDETYVDNINNYISTLEFELSSVKMPNQSFENYSTDWETVCLKIYEMPEFGSELNKSGYFENDIKSLLAGINDKNEKIDIIFNYVKSKVKWNGYHDYYCHDSVKEAYKNGTGNVAEINLMLIAMLRYAGIDTNPVLISTRNNGIPLYPSRTAFNYVVAGIESQEELILLDATEKYSFPNLLPDRAINWNGRIIRKNGSSANVNLNPKFVSKEITNMYVSFNAEDKIEGKIRSQKNDYNAFQFRDTYNTLNEETYLEKLEKKLNESQISDYKIENKTVLSKPIVETFSFTNSNELEKIGEKIYITPLMFYKFNENPFKQENREYPVDFTFPEQNKYQIIFSLPENYNVEFLPSPMKLEFSDKSLSYLFNISNTGKQIQIISQLDINTSIVSPENYEELKAFFAEIVKKQTEKIVIKKN